LLCSIARRLYIETYVGNELPSTPTLALSGYTGVFVQTLPKKKTDGKEMPDLCVICVARELFGVYAADRNTVLQSRS
jgi:hypothetical protein